jgi:hypothetical protein
MQRDAMAPDTEPTDEELALVMREARSLAIQRRAKADAWIAARLEEAEQYARREHPSTSPRAPMSRAMAPRPRLLKLVEEEKYEDATVVRRKEWDEAGNFIEAYELKESDPASKALLLSRSVYGGQGEKGGYAGYFEWVHAF